VITGNLGLSPAAASFITGFSLTRAGTLWTTPQVIGDVFAANNDPPTPTDLTIAILNMQTAYTDAAGRPTPDALNLAAGAIGGLTIVPGLYKWTSSVTIPTDLEEAARIDGAGPIGIALRLKVPLIRKWIAYMVILSFATGTQLFVEPQLVTQASLGLVPDTWSSNQLAPRGARRRKCSAGRCATSARCCSRRRGSPATLPATSACPSRPKASRRRRRCCRSRSS